MNRFSQLLILNLSLITTLLPSVSCQQKKPASQMAAGYDLQNPQVIQLSSLLDEISGIAFSQKDNSLFAISDESGDLYKITLGDTTVYTTWVVTKKKDFEDIVMLDSNFYFLNSHGSIVKIHFAPPAAPIVTSVKIAEGEKNEFESMYYDQEDKHIKVLCKKCEDDSKKNVTGFMYDPATDKMLDSTFEINVKQIDKMMDVKSMKLKPSAAAINPQTGELFVLCSVNKLLVIVKKNGEAKAVYPLSNPLFKQPEGMCFTASGTLIISNESHKTGNATLLIFKHK